MVVAGFVVAGLAADRAHLGDDPHSNSVLSQLDDEVAGSSCSTGALHLGDRHAAAARFVGRLIERRLAGLPSDPAGRTSAARVADPGR